MEIKVRLNKNFQTQYNKLQGEFGTEIARLNGFDDDQLSYTDFIANFIDEPVVADSSIDGNSNVSSKNINSLLNEMPKPHRKLLAFNKIYYEMQKKFGFKEANKFLRYDWIGYTYLHDADTASFRHYCYKGDESVTVKQGQRIFNISLKDIPSLCDESEKCFDEALQQEVYRPKDLYIADQDYKWTKILRFVAHPNDKPMRFIKLSNGLSQIVTADHPWITQNGEVAAQDLTEQDQIQTFKPEYFDNLLYKVTVKGNEIQLNQDIGWLVASLAFQGAPQADHSFVTYYLEDTDSFQRVRTLLKKYKIPYTESMVKNWQKAVELQPCSFTQWITTININQALSKTYIHYATGFLNGFVAGMIDTYGIIDRYKGRHCIVAVHSEKVAHQLSNFLQHQGITCGDQFYSTKAEKRAYKGKAKHEVYGIEFSLTNEKFFLSIDSLNIKEHYVPKERIRNYDRNYESSYGWVSVTENIPYPEDCPEVYDITTETGHFLCNNIVSHNCYAYDLKNLAEKGLYFLDRSFNNQPPRHLSTFIDFVKEFISFTSNLSSGACGLPNLIPYMYYFWKKDCDNNYLGMKTAKQERIYAYQQIQRFIYAVNQPYVRDSIQSAFTNTSIFDHPYFEALFGGSSFPDGTPMIDYEEEIIEFEKMFLEEMSIIRSENMLTFPVNSISLLRTADNSGFVDEDFARYAVEHNMKWSDSNLFCDTSVNSLSNCCRLKSDITELYFNSIGGTALSVGSVKVDTVNLARLALESDSIDEFIDRVYDVTYTACEVLDCVRHIIKRNEEKGLLPNFSHKLVEWEHLYNTVGVIGCYETMKKFGFTENDDLGNMFYTQEGKTLGKTIFDTIRKAQKTFSDKYNVTYKLNIEQIPGENAAAKLMKKDKFFYPDADIYDLPLYGNQFIPLGIKTTLQNRIETQALFDAFCNGGSILHCNIDAPFDSFDKAWKMTNYIASQGVTYFAFNTKIQACEDNHAFYGTTCPVCGKPIATEYTRIVGFYTPVKTWSRERKNEYGLRRWANIDKEMENDS